jgi:hypothetical protein
VRLSVTQHRELVEARRNLGVGAFPPGSPEREIVVGIMWHAVKNYFDGDETAFEWLKSDEAAELLSWIGLPHAAFCARLKETWNNQVVREAIRPVMHRHDIAEAMMTKLV